jgi:8-amino-7-oxononanoate synthase
MSDLGGSQAAYGWLPATLQTIQRANRWRQVQQLDGLAGPIMRREGRAVLNFASNDYLGLAADPRLAKSAIAAIQTYGTGSTGSRLLSGQREVHRILERAIANFKHTDDAIVFSSGYLANLGTIAALVNHRDLILSDAYNHASLINGAKLSGAAVIPYAHCDMSDLKAKLNAHRHSYRRCLIVTDSIFSMDGDLCPLDQLLDIAEAFAAMVLVDEAHATGVLGKHGAGAVEHFGCTGRPLIQMGTLSKALGSLGGYVTGSGELIDFLRNRASSWIYTTGLSPADAAAATVAIDIVQQEPQRRQCLHQNANYLNQQLDALLTHQSANASTNASISHSTYPKRLPSQSPIICIEVKDTATVLTLAQHLKNRDIFVSAVRPPTVPTSRLRCTVMATHTLAQIETLVNALLNALVETVSSP